MPNKITLNADVFAVPLNKLALSPRNVRRTYSAEEIDDMATSIAVAGRGLIQNLGVTEQIGEDGQPTGIWEVVAGGRRYRALKLLAERKRLALNVAVPCRRVEEEAALDTSLAENEDRKALHPADAYEAFAELHQDGAGFGVEEIAARFSVSAHIVRQRLRLGTVSPVVLASYRAAELDLDQVMAFAVTEDRAAQERVFGELPAWQRTPQTIRRVLTQHNVPAHDPRVLLVGLDAYVGAGGRVERDLFTEDGGGWLADVPLLERLVGERIQAAADQVRAEGWKWVATDYADARAAWNEARRVWLTTVPLPEADEARRTELSNRLDELESEYPTEDAPNEVQAEMQAIIDELDALDAREHPFRPEDMARAGVRITLAADGQLRIERGFVRPEDDLPPEHVAEAGEKVAEWDGNEAEDERPHAKEPATTTAPSRDDSPALSAELDAELTAHRTAALRAEIMRQPELALRVLAHSLATATFYAPYLPTVVRAASPYATVYGGSGRAEDAARQAITAAEDAQKEKLPPTHDELWDWLQRQDLDSLHALIAVCIGRTAEAGREDWTEGRTPLPAQVAMAAGLDMRQWWTVSRASYLSRVTKAGILAAVREGAGDDAARRIEAMKKDAMAENAETLLAGTGWLPARLRVPGTEAERVEHGAEVIEFPEAAD